MNIVKGIRSNRSKVTVGIVACVLLVSAVVILFIFTPLGRSEIPPLDSPEECANKPVKGKLVLNVEETELPEISEKITVYEYEPLLKDEKEIQEFAARLGITAELEFYDKDKEYDNLDVYSVRQGDLGISYYSNTGEILFRNHALHGRELPGIPSKEESKAFALQVINELGLFPDGCNIVGTGGEIRIRGNDDGSQTSTYIDRDVAFSPKLDGIKIIGRGMELRVTIGTMGEFTGLTGPLRNIKPYKEYKVKSIDEAARDAQDGNNTMNLYSDVKDPEVTEVKLLYYADPAEPENKYLQPVYALTGPDTCIYVPAIKQ